MKNEGFLLLNLYALIILIILCVIFFTKSKIRKLENDIYARLLLTSVVTITIGLLLGTTLNFEFKYSDLILNILNWFGINYFIVWNIYVLHIQVWQK